MKKYKKIGLGLSALVFLALAILSVTHTTSVLAAAQPFTNNKIFSGAKYTLNSDGTITTTLIDNAANTTQNYPLVFTDSTPNNSSHIYTSDQKIFCAAQTDFRDSVAATITLSGAPSGKTVTGQLSAYVLGAGASACTNNSGSISITNTNPSTGGSPALPFTITYGTDVYTLVDPAFPLYGLNSGNKGTDCYGGSVILANAAATSGTAYLGLEGNGGTIPLQPVLIKAGANSNVLNLITGCGFQDPSANTAGYSGTITNGLLNAPFPTSTVANTSGSTGCEANYSHPFTWILCPAMDIADDAAGQFNSFVQNQLCFNTGPTSSTSGIVCSGNNNLTDSVKSAWNIFKNIASALLVIAMLVMVFSQAIGGGPFDAYTVRKMLPKLVAAVIIMQLSWVLLKWSIDLTNDIGTTVAKLMMAPFGGTGTLSLQHLVGFDLNAQSTATSTVAATFVFFGALAGLAIVSVPGLAMLALYVVLALLTAFVVLLLRKMLLILLVIAAPIALVAWILPGTERYWKLWKDNFTKLLLMFPMIEALIAAGKIFAYIASGNSTGSIFAPHLGITHVGPLLVPYFGTFTNFVDLIIIIGAWFAPYFFLPQTFKWGGTALATIGKGVQQGVEKGASPAKEYLKWRQGLSPWKQARAARRAKQELRSKTAFYGGLGAEGLRGNVRRARLRSVFRPTPGGLREEQALVNSIVTGGAQRAEEEALKEANQALDQELATDPSALADHDQFVIRIARAGPGASVHGRVRSEADWRAAVEKLYQYGGPNNRVFEQLHSEAMSRPTNDPVRAQWEKITNALAPQILPKFPFVHKDRDYSIREADPASPNFGALGDLNTTISQLTPESFTKAGIEGEAVETILGHLSTLIREGDVHLNPAATAGQIARGNQARQQVATMYSLFNQTVTNESTRGNVNPAAGRAFMAAATGVGVGTVGVPNSGINAERGTPGVPAIDASVINNTIVTSPDPDMPAVMSSILATVRPDGNPR